MSKQQTVSRPLLGVLAATMLVAGYLGQGALLGADDPSENGFGDFSPIAFSSDGDEIEDAWVMPENPRNPFLPFFAPDDVVDGSSEDTDLDLSFTE